MNLLGNNPLPSILKDPFKKDNIDEIDICMSTHMFGEKTKYWTGYVKFTNGQTSGTQRFKSENAEQGFLIITKEIEQFIKSL